MTDLAIQELRGFILKAKYAYYYSVEPIMSDAKYDALEDQLCHMVPDDPVLASVGSPLCIYFTDGVGSFPSNLPASPVVWVVTPGGLETPGFMFGIVARIGATTDMSSNQINRFHIVALQ